MTWQDELKDDPIPWLLEPDAPGVRYLAMRDLLDLPADDPELNAARADAHSRGPIAAILAEMNPEGYWVRAWRRLQPQVSIHGMVDHHPGAIRRLRRSG